MSAEPGDFSLRIPEQWYELDLDRSTRKKTTEQAVDAQVRSDPILAEARDAIVDRLLAFAGDAEEKGALAGAALWTVIDGVELAANVMVFGFNRESPEDLEAELAGLEATLTRRSAADVGGRTVERVTLAAGPAIRLRVLAESAAEPGSNGRAQGGEGGIVVDTVQHWLPVPDASHTLVVSGTTPCLAYGDDFAGIFDSIAGSLHLL